MDARTTRRQPAAGHGQFTRDGLTVWHTKAERWPRVGNDSTLFIWIDDPQQLELLEHWHRSAPIRSITQLSPQQPADVPG